MKILNKIIEKQKDINNAKPINVVFLGDSITQGCFECYFDDSGVIQTRFDYKSGYPTRFREIMNLLYPSVQINVINSGISGDNAQMGNKRFDRDVKPYNPDLVVVAFGVNDPCCGKDFLDTYLESLQGIFDKVKKCKAECVFIAQNTLNTKISCHLKTDKERDLAKFFVKVQEEGTVKLFFDKAKELCKKNKVAICDMYSAWETLNKNGVDTTELFANKYNHPIKEMHYYTAIKLVEKLYE